MADLRVLSIPMRTRFRGIDTREVALLRGAAGWGEWSPFLEYDARVAEPWLRCAEEAAAGDWPEEAVRMMDSIARSVEADAGYKSRVRLLDTPPDPTIADALAHSCMRIADTMPMTGIIVFTCSGSSAPQSRRCGLRSCRCRRTAPRAGPKR